MQALEHHLVKQVDSSVDFFWHRIRWRMAARRFPSGATFTLLDIGAGAGLSGVYLKREFPRARYMFVEPIASLADRLTQIYGRDSRQGPNGSYAEASHVLLFDVVEHMQDDRGFVTKIVEKLAPGARLFVTVPALSFLWSEWDKDLGHFRRYTKQSLLRLFEGMPVSIERAHYLFPELVLPGLVRKWTHRPGSEKSAKRTEFPQFAPWINAGLTGLFSATSLAWPLAPVGSSMFVQVKKI